MEFDIKDILKRYWFSILIMAQPILDIIAYFQQDNVIGSTAGYLRLVVMVILPIMVLFKTKKKKSFLAWLAVIGIYCVLHIANCFRVGYISIFQDVAYMARVIQMPVITISLIYYFEEDHAAVNHQIEKSFYFNSVLIFVSVIIAFLTGTGEYTYVLYDAGLKGWFQNANGQSIILASLIPFMLSYSLKKKKFIFLLLTSVFSWFILISNGTKVDYYAIFIIFGGYFIYLIFEYWVIRKENKKLNLPALCLFALLMVISVVGYDYTPRAKVDLGNTTAREDENVEMNEALSSIQNSGESMTIEEMMADPEIKDELLTYLTPKLPSIMVDRFGAERVLVEGYGYIPDAYMLADTRANKVRFAQMLWSDSDMLTRLVGFEYSNVIDYVGNEGTYDLENDYPALFYYYGYLGCGLYLLFLGYFVFRLARKVIFDFKNSVNLFNFSLLLVFGIQLFAAQLSGAILRRPNVSIYLSIVLMLIYFQTDHWKKVKEDTHA